MPDIGGNQDPKPCLWRVVGGFRIGHIPLIPQLEDATGLLAAVRRRIWEEFYRQSRGPGDSSTTCLHNFTWRDLIATRE